MKTPTTEFSIAVHEQAQINREFLLSQGWELRAEYPLFEEFIHSRNANLVCSIGLYGEFSLAELHWLNKTPDKQFSTLNSKLTRDDYKTIVSLLNITHP